MAQLRWFREEVTTGGKWLVLRDEFLEYERRNNLARGSCMSQRESWRAFPETMKLATAAGLFGIGFNILESGSRLPPHRGGEAGIWR